MSRGCTAPPFSDPSTGLPTATAQLHTASIQDRFLYNPTFESVFSIVPSVPALLLLLIPAILMTVSIVREKELGSIINFYVTPDRPAGVPDGQAGCPTWPSA